MKAYKTPEERAEIIEWLNSDTRGRLAEKSAISYAAIAQLRANPDKEVGLNMVARIKKAVTEWKRQKWHATHDQKPAAAPAEAEPAKQQGKDLHGILLDLIQAELNGKTDEQLVAIYKTILKA